MVMEKETKTASREQFGTKIGFILAAAGSAVGLGNIWKFPYLAGSNGGGAFVLVYLLCVVVIGFSLMLMEMALGEALNYQQWVPTESWTKDLLSLV
jgi:NSS family neurotransmitter:Na+ symporter